MHINTPTPTHPHTHTHNAHSPVYLAPGPAPRVARLTSSPRGRHLDDHDSAVRAFERAVALDETLERPAPLLYLNYAVLLGNHGDTAGAVALLARFQRLCAAAPTDEVRPAAAAGLGGSHAHAERRCGVQMDADMLAAADALQRTLQEGA